MTKASIEHAKKHSKEWHENIKKKVFSSVEGRAAYERTKKEMELFIKLKKTREKFNLSQEVVAERMHTSRTTVSRLESANFGSRNSPSIDTLLRYIQALGGNINFNVSFNKKKLVARK